MAIDWKKQARRWQRAFHALQDEMLYGAKTGSRIKPKKEEKKTVSKPKKAKKTQKPAKMRKKNAHKSKNIFQQLDLF